MALSVETPDLTADTTPTSTAIVRKPMLARSQTSVSDSDDVEAQCGQRTSRIEKPFESDTDSSLAIGKQITLEADNSIKYRTEFCLLHPDVKDVCDIGKILFWGKNWAWYLTAAMFLLNNTFIQVYDTPPNELHRMLTARQGFHCLVGSKYLNTISNHGMCTIGFSAILAVVSFFCSLPRTFSTLAKVATASALFTFVSVILATVFAIIEEHPNGYDGTPPKVLIVPAVGTGFVAGMNAFMNISYTFIGQITIPSFIAEMKDPATSLRPSGR
ncbi:hypothetical protein H2199_001760 [Coniosporium tulheliwenetii]|uniref:Uncharacterized protein n=1 Tax=Coniosporium tulheliwenetii TaxID=3383036 RepID=A0ACC2ZKG4_9PEZI|nr:hypothetical protein H2199_001760 [Cladosporium sp. JES 115]